MTEDKPQTAEEYRNAELRSDAVSSNEPKGHIPEDPVAELQGWLTDKVAEAKAEGQFGHLDLVDDDTPELIETFDLMEPPKGASDEEVEEAVKEVEG